MADPTNTVPFKDFPDPRKRQTDTPTIVTKALITYFMAGFSPDKIRHLLQTIPDFSTVDGPQYQIQNLEATCRSLQSQNRKGDKEAPHMRIVMDCPDPFHIRANANRAFAEKFPAQASEMGERADMAEMRVWQARWREEARLLRGTAFYDFDDKANAIDKCLDDYERQLVRENPRIVQRTLRKVSSAAAGLTASVTIEKRAKCLSSQSESPSPKRGRNASPAGGQLRPQVLPHPPPLPPGKPNLKLTTRGVSASRVEGTATPGRAQFLDPEGFFSPRPRTQTP